jgi:Spy/CpxP family protein refolding chaperone
LSISEEEISVKNNSYCSARNKAIVALSAVFLIISLAGCSTTSGQGLRSRQSVKTTGQLVDEMSSRLNLTEEQKAQVRPILEEQREKRAAIMEQYRDQGRGAKIYMQDDMEALELETQVKLAKVLTEEQMKEYRAMVTEQKTSMTEQKSQRGSRGGKGGGGGRRGRF